MERQFPLSVFVFIDSSVVSVSQNNLEFPLGYHNCCLNYFTLVYLWCGRMVGRWTITLLPNFLGCVVYHIFSPMVLCCTRFARESSANKTGCLQNTKWSYYFPNLTYVCFYSNIDCNCWKGVNSCINFTRIFRSFSIGKREQKSYRSQKIVDIV